MAMDTSFPLTTAELHKLDALLKEQGGMSVIQLHGFLTAIASGPYSIAVTGWLPFIWGFSRTLPKRPDFFATLKAVGGLHAFITQTLEKGELLYPLLSLNDAPSSPDAADQQALTNWNQGYVKGIMMTPDAWKQPEHREICFSLLAFLRFAYNDKEAQEHFETLAGKGTYPSLHAAASDALPFLVAEIDRYWKAQDIDTRSHAIDCNEICLCASGKEFKYCCGRDALKSRKGRSPALMY